MEKKILRELQNITKELSGIKKELKKSNKEEGEDLIYDTEVAIESIHSKFKEDGLTEVTKGVIAKMLDYEEDYMRSVGIIKD